MPHFHVPETCFIQNVFVFKKKKIFLIDSSYAGEMLCIKVPQRHVLKLLEVVRQKKWQRYSQSINVPKEKRSVQYDVIKSVLQGLKG